ncbi:hypothetical protein IV203_005674 [Nitzschia inconspicua]|uniref:Uncharacterized protein n=1 Tax=Nitzschia inconspicua TaxID=303405 RepID=A0A9K3KP91_9STRA|nr:hypothetical protein IV203_005674 [Nitzschia inconspicua]
MSTDDNGIFTWKKPEPDPEDPPSQGKWTEHKTIYEIYAHTLKGVSAQEVVTHCAEIKGQVKQAVSNDNHLGPSCFQVFPRTLTTSLSSVWTRAVADLGPNAPQTVENFDEAIKNFVGAHTGTQDRHALVQQLIHPTKPRDLGVQAFYYRLLELNDAISLIPGAAHDAPLNDEQLKQASYDGMPAIWKERFVNSGSRLTEMARAEVIRYFRDQEHLVSNGIVIGESLGICFTVNQTLVN